MARWKGGHCPKCGRPIAQKVGAPANPCPDCTIEAQHPAGPQDADLARLKAQWQAEVLYEFTHGSYVMPATLNLAMRKRADDLYLQAVCPGPGKCDDPGCPAHYAGPIGDAK